MNNLISIIIPVFNLEKEVSRCLNSVLDQSYRRIEIIIVNDGSTDKTSKVCKEFLKKDSRIRYIETEGLGVSAARNIGLREARGSYISFIDGDDWIETDFYERLMELFESFQADICACNVYNQIYENGNFIKTRRYSAFLNNGVQYLDTGGIRKYGSRFGWVVWNKIFKKNIIDGLKMNESVSYGEDSLFFADAMYRAKSMVILPDYCGYNYYINRQGNVVSLITPQKADMLMNSAVILYEKAREYHWNLIGVQRIVVATFEVLNKAIQIDNNRAAFNRYVSICHHAACKLKLNDIFAFILSSNNNIKHKICLILIRCIPSSVYRIMKNKENRK